jgi:hypothetical protein
MFVSNKRPRLIDGIQSESFDEIFTKAVISDWLPYPSLTWSLGSAAYIWLAAWIQTINSGLIQPIVTATYDIGTTAKRFKDGWFSGNLIAATFNSHATPAGTADLMDVSSTQTATDKTLISPILTSPTINGNLTPVTDGEPILGSASKRWGNIFLIGWIISYTNIIFTYVNSAFTFALTAYPDVLTVSNTVRVPTNSATATDVVVLEAHVQTLSNKTYVPITATQATTFSWVGAGSGGSTGSGSVNLVYTKFGNWVDVAIPALSGTNGAGGNSIFQSGATDVPAAYRPTSTTKVNAGIALSLNGAWQNNAAVNVTSGGQITFASDPAFNTNIPASNAIVVSAFNFRYYIGT